MTRSNLILEIASQQTNNPIYFGLESPINPLVAIMHKKIEAVYSVLFSIEKLEGDDPATKAFHKLGELIRKALEF